MVIESCRWELQIRGKVKETEGGGYLGAGALARDACLYVTSGGVGNQRNHSPQNENPDLSPPPALFLLPLQKNKIKQMPLVPEYLPCSSKLGGVARTNPVVLTIISFRGAAP